MTTCFRKFANFIRAEEGAAAIEYAAILSLIVLWCQLSIQTIGSVTEDSFSRTDAALSASNSQNNSQGNGNGQDNGNHNGNGYGHGGF